MTPLARRTMRLENWIFFTREVGLRRHAAGYIGATYKNETGARRRGLRHASLSDPGSQTRRVPVLMCRLGLGVRRAGSGGLWRRLPCGAAEIRPRALPVARPTPSRRPAAGREQLAVTLRAGTSITVTRLSLVLATNARLPSGVIWMPTGAAPTRDRGQRLAACARRTPPPRCPARQDTHASRPSGVNLTRIGKRPTFSS